jgi:hypothetical protein
MALISRDVFLKPYVPPVEEVLCPEFGPDAAVAVQGMTVRERSAFESQFLNKKSGERMDSKVQEYRERTIVACCRDASGAPLFTLADVRQLGLANPTVVDRLVTVARRLSGMTSDESMEDAEKNSEPTPGD